MESNSPTQLHNSLQPKEKESDRFQMKENNDCVKIFIFKVFMLCFLSLKHSPVNFNLKLRYSVMVSSTFMCECLETKSRKWQLLLDFIRNCFYRL